MKTVKMILPLLLCLAVVCGCGKKGCAEQYCSATGLVRMAKDYATADAIRKELADKGVTLIDTAEGTKYKIN